MVNISCDNQVLQNVEISFVCNCAHIMNLIRTAIGKLKQGSSDPESPWAKSRLQWITQYAIRVVTYKWNTETIGDFPATFDIIKLGKLEISQIGYWYEWHK